MITIEFLNNVYGIVFESLLICSPRESPIYIFFFFFCEFLSVLLANFLVLYLKLQLTAQSVLFLFVFFKLFYLFLLNKAFVIVRHLFLPVNHGRKLQFNCLVCAFGELFSLSCGIVGEKEILAVSHMRVLWGIILTLNLFARHRKLLFTGRKLSVCVGCCIIFAGEIHDNFFGLFVWAGLCFQVFWSHNISKNTISLSITRMFWEIGVSFVVIFLGKLGILWGGYIISSIYGGNVLRLDLFFLQMVWRLVYMICSILYRFCIKLLLFALLLLGLLTIYNSFQGRFAGLLEFCIFYVNYLMKLL